MSVIIFFSASKNNFFFGRNDVQAIDFLRKGSYAPDVPVSFIPWTESPSDSSVTVF